MTTTDGPGRPDVELRVPADGAFASVLRTTTAGLAARLDFTIDDIEDLRIAVGEAHALALEQAPADVVGDLLCGFTLQPGRITVTVSVAVDGAVEPDLQSFAWQVLSTLASEADWVSGDGRFTVTMTMTSSALPPVADAPAAL
ncbi:MAG: anti-sigma factor [Nocardioides sp.]|nr:anti-sigma factor [Nocardioides sp.]